MRYYYFNPQRVKIKSQQKQVYQDLWVKDSGGNRTRNQSFADSCLNHFDYGIMVGVVGLAPTKPGRTADLQSAAIAAMRHPDVQWLRYEVGGAAETRIRTQGLPCYSPLSRRVPCQLGLPLLMQSTPNGGVEPHSIAATHGFQDRCRGRPASFGKC